MPSASPTKVLSLETREGWEAYRNSFPGSTRAYIHTWEEKVKRDKELAVDRGPAVDRSGFDLNEANGWVVTPILTNGQLYTFTLGKPGTVLVYGVGGNFVSKVNGQPVAGERGASIPNQSGTVTLSVESVNGRVGVQVV